MIFEMNESLVPQDLKPKVEDVLRSWYPSAEIAWKSSSLGAFLLSMSTGEAGQVSAEWTKVGTPLAPREASSTKLGLLLKRSEIPSRLSSYARRNRCAFRARPAKGPDQEGGLSVESWRL
jgi:hypothetical protein